MAVNGCFRCLRTLLLACAASAAAAAHAHHSITSEFDPTVVIELAGTIAAVEIVNPHVRITLQSGQGEWQVEMAAPLALQRRGIDPKTLLTVGRQVSVEVFPALDGSLRVNGRTLVADGKRFDVGDGFGWQQLDGPAARPPPAVR